MSKVKELLEQVKEVNSVDEALVNVLYTDDEELQDLANRFDQDGLESALDNVNAKDIKDKKIAKLVAGLVKDVSSLTKILRTFE